jgi:hypothetical protein
MHTEFRSSVRRLFVTANVVSSSPTLVALMMEALRSSERRFLQEPHGITSQKTIFYVSSHHQSQIFVAEDTLEAHFMLYMCRTLVSLR